VTWRRAGRGHAQTAALADTLADTLATIAAGDAEVVVLASASGHFCAGWEVEDLPTDAAPEALEAYFASGRRLLDAISSLPQLTVGTVTGAALGYGLSVLGRCDLVVAEETACFGLPEIRLGMVPALALAELLGVTDRRTALAWAASGATFDAEAARQAGVVSALVAPGGLDAWLADLVGPADAVSARPLRQTKALAARLAGADADESRRLALAAAVETVRARRQVHGDAPAGVDRAANYQASPEVRP
jgi:enoyl-CoA hydratase/carnithine racemase